MLEVVLSVVHTKRTIELKTESEFTQKLVSIKQFQFLLIISQNRKLEILKSLRGFYDGLAPSGVF